MPAIKIIQQLPQRKAMKKIDKPNNTYSWFINQHCICGCRLRTDNKQVWCSGVNCNYMISKQNFLDSLTDKSEFTMTFTQFSKLNKIYLA